MEQPPSEFVVNFDDLADLKAKRKLALEAVEYVEQQLAGLHELEKRLAMWRARVEFIESQLPPDLSVVIESTDVDTRREEKAAARERPGWLQELVVEVVNREVRKIRSMEVRAILIREGYDVSAEQVSNALHYAAHGAKPKNKIQDAPGRGMYAPLAYQEIELPDPTATNGATGPQAQTRESYSAPAGEDWSGARHPATST